MDFSDEPYVRKYTRKTVTNRLLGWEGRAVLDAMLGEFDPAGIFEIRGDAARCIMAVTEIPLEVVKLALQRLIETETWVVTARSITWPTYEEAQNCMRSDRIRKRESRRARSAQSVTGADTIGRAVTNVTSGHAESREVTLPPSAPSHPSPLPVLPVRDPDRAREVTETRPVPGLRRVVGAGGVARVHSLPSKDPPQDYLDEAAMRGVLREQAESTWKFYRGKGLPAEGVERLNEWLCQMAIERSKSTARAGPKAEGDRIKRLVERANAMGDD